MRSLVILVLSCCGTGCALWNGDHGADYRTIAGDPNHDTESARKKNECALAYMEAENWPKAEKALNEALIADVTYGPAHNNLGKVYYAQTKLYLAAWEFEYAMKLMPDRPEPHNNLGLVYEAASKLDQAIEFYEIAAGMAPECAEYTANLARAKLRRGDSGVQMKELLTSLQLYETRPEWREWVDRQLNLGTFRPASQATGWQPSSRGDEQEN